MPRVIGQTAYGNSVLQDDGTVVFLPPWADAGGFGAGAPAQSDLAGMAPDAPLNPPVPAPDAIAPDGSALAPPAVAPAPPLDVTQPQKVIEPPPSNVLGLPDGSPSASTAADIAPGPPVIAAPQPAVETPPVAPPAPAPEPPPPLTPVDQAAQAETDKAAIAQAKSAEDVRVYNEATAAEQTALDNVRAERENYTRQFESTRSAYEMATKEAAKFDARVPEDTTGTKFSKLIFMALGGLGQVLQRQGGPNPVMAILDAAVEREAQARLKRYQQLQAKAGGLKAGLDAIADMAKTPEGYLNGVRASIRARLTTEIEKNAATFAGPTALATAKAVNADNLAKAEKAAADAARADTEVTLNAQKQAEVERENKAREKIARGQLAVQWSGEKRANAKFAADQVQSVLDNVGKIQDVGLKAQAAKLAAEKSGAEVVKLANEAKGNVVIDPVTRKPMARSPDAGPLDDTSARDLRKKVGQTFNTVQTLDAIERLVEKNGGESGVLKGAGWQEITAANEFARQQIRIAMDMGALDKQAGESMINMMGGVDPTSFIRDALPGQRRARLLLMQNANSALAANGFDGAWDVPAATNAALAGRVESKERAEVRKITADETGAGSFERLATAIRGAKLIPEKPYKGEADALINVAKGATPDAESAKAALAEVALKRPAIAKAAIAAGVDFSTLPQLSPESLAQIRAAAGGK